MSQTLNNFFENFLMALRTQGELFARQVPGILLAIVIIAIGFFLSQKISDLTKRAIAHKTHDPITANFLSKAIKLLLLAMFAMYALKLAGLGTIANGILTAAGASAVIIGFAFKDIGENFISGIILSFNRPFNVNETVSVGEIFGKVKSIEFRYTKLRTFDGRDVYIPNSDVIKKPVFNYTEDGFYRFDFVVGIAYENDIERAQEIIMETVKTTEFVLTDEAHPYFVFADELAVNSVNLKVHFWISTFEFGREAMTIKGKVVSRVKSALLTNGFGLPANIVEMKMYDSEGAIPITLNNSDLSSRT